MKQMTIKLIADFEMPDDFKLTPENYDAVRISFLDTEGHVRGADIRLKDKNAKDGEQRASIED